MPASFRQQVSRFLDGSPAAGQARGPLAVDIRKPLAEGTVNQVKEALDGNGPPRPDSRPAAGQGAPRRVLVLAYTQDNAPVQARVNPSKEVKQFRAGRKPLQPGTVQVVLMLIKENA